jgi:hypothetical protein
VFDLNGVMIVINHGYLTMVLSTQSQYNMLMPSFKKWSLRIFGLLVLVGLGTVGWVEYQIRVGRGTYTEVVDQHQFELEAGDFAITNVSLLDPTGETMLDSQTVLISEGLIKSVEKEGDVPPGHKAINGSGQYLIPGLTDSHVHFRSNPNDLLLYLANGVTSVREMTGNATHLGWRSRLGDDLIGPKMYISSKKITSKAGLAGLFQRWAYNKLNYADADKGRSVIRKAKASGFDALKMSNFISREMYLSTMEIAKEEGIPVIGHIPDDIPLEEFLTLGQYEVAHIEELTKSLIREFGGMGSENAEEYLDFVRQRSPAIAKGLHDNGIAVTTTVWLMESLPRQKFGLKAALKTVQLKYANPAWVEGTPLMRGWLPGHSTYQLSEVTKNDPDAMERSRVFWKTYVEAIHIMTPYLVEQGVLLMAGTDTNAALIVPGFSLHDEMASLVNAGMTPAETLFSATAAPAKWAGEKTGSIRVGYAADLVLLRKNPLADISNTKAIESVFLGGQLISKEQLEAMLAAVATANLVSRNIDIREFE